MTPNDIVLPTCEISMDPETAVEVGLEWGIRHFELKTLWEGKRVPLISEQQRSHLINLSRNYGVEFPILSPGLFIGTSATDETAKQEIAEKLPRCIELAQDLSATLIVEVRQLVAHVHLKNYCAARQRWALFDQGDIDLQGQLRALRADGYGGFLAIETHTRFNPEFSPVLGASRHNLAVLRRWLEEE